MISYFQERAKATDQVLNLLNQRVDCPVAHETETLESVDLTSGVRR